MFTWSFLRPVLERAVSTFAQTLLGILAAFYQFSDVDWATAISASGFAALLSAIKSFVSYGATGTASAIGAEAISAPAAKHAAPPVDESKMDGEV